MTWSQHDDLMVYECEKQSGDCAPDRRVFFLLFSAWAWLDGRNQSSHFQCHKWCVLPSLLHDGHFHDNRTLRCLKMSEFQGINSRYSLLLTSEPGSWKTPVKFQWHLTRQHLCGWIMYMKMSLTFITKRGKYLSNSLHGKRFVSSTWYIYVVHHRFSLQSKSVRINCVNMC